MYSLFKTYRTLGGFKASVSGECNSSGYWGTIILANGDSYPAIWTSEGKCIEKPEYSLPSDTSPQLDEYPTARILNEYLTELNSRIGNIENFLRQMRAKHDGGLS